ncbi:glutaminase A [Salibacterium sp. K-3]
MPLFIEEETLTMLMQTIKPKAETGTVASYIPALQKSDPATFGCAIRQGRACTEAGGTDIHFTLQSVSKVISLALALMDRGPDNVFSRVGMEPSGNPFHSIQALEKEKPSRPLNPMINAGALVVTDMIQRNQAGPASDRFLRLLQQMTGNPGISICEETATSERRNADLNRSLCYFLKSHGVLDGDVEHVLHTYIDLCSVQVNCRDLARIGTVIGGSGRDPETGESIIPDWAAKIVTTFMVTCGMYNASGAFAIKAGIPAKSGVSGALVGSLPDGTGIGVYSPPLDSYGNSAAGTALMETLSERCNLSIFSGRYG